ncbi:hypothetical protein [Fervidobacterium nodosum]|uniref:Uncharacterized protein n=1 Tax=Fervidobacterium nodosum (strain ATCC 35602 / DSM 5306 / Rt17-B1) TaxID=381764 RepID=A7HNQ5_FERNB|nr:hypothetical protein [Fervidobacterium nodosum]ABS61538.1 hypothetical protein Fnod_1703 [Fervidobacterium nodosum Rt17-B1]
MKKNIPVGPKFSSKIGSRRWREVTDFDLKILSWIIIFFSLATITLALYAFYLKIQKSQVEVVVKEITPENKPPVEKVINTATETTIILESAKDITNKFPNSETTITVFESPTDSPDEPKENQQTSEIKILVTKPNNEIGEDLKSTTSTKPATEVSMQTDNQQNQIAQSEENKYLKDLTKFDYNLLVSRMAENLPSSAMSNVYVYSVDGENALKIAKSTQNYVIDQDNKSYVVLTLSNVMPEVKPMQSAYTVITEPIKDSKEAFKSVVNFRALGISSFSISTANGYVICLGVFTREDKAKSFYYSQDWVELSKYGYVKGAKVTKIGK